MILMFIIILPAMKLIGKNATKRLKRFELKSFRLKYANIFHINMIFIIKIKLNKVLSNLLIFLKAPVAQLDRALGYGPGGSGFKS